jgi:DNA-binding transcriptional MerR regulator
MGPREVARATGVSTDTLRHYEAKGLLPRAVRTPAGYRQYPASAINRVLLIQRALVVGFSLDDVQRVLAVRDRGGAPCRGVRDLVGKRLEALSGQIDQLSALRDELTQLLEEWDGRLAATAAGERAHLLETLGAKTQIERARHARTATAIRRGARTLQRS